ncbi:RNA polymerase sigma factor [Chondrinema litorale]|uniref:RNA polymerase sigma factor n=1 Tax=Chondrinema litorale TaxID=2994555 RepID=UPI0025432CE9|nr:sigma-70 family RNA polymerase sigma factor [Chondrinema litorale]UZR99221.1 sigma-70 family RNA polymerase sigma factor [Chondrinema litorale]
MKTCKKHFVRLIEEHQGIINNLCAIYYNNTEDLHDTRQDIILQLWKAFPSFRAESKVSTWIYKVSLNTILSKKRKENRQGKSEPMELITNNEFINQQVSFSFDDNLQLLNQLIATLKDTDKAIIILFLEGYKNKEMAEMLGITTTNVSTRLNRIKTVLKEKFKMISYGA